MNFVMSRTNIGVYPPPPHFGNRTERDTRTVIIVSRSAYRPLDGRPLYHVDIKMFSFHATKDAGYRTLITFLLQSC